MPDLLLKEYWLTELLERNLGIVRFDEQESYMPAGYLRGDGQATTPLPPAFSPAIRDLFA